MGKWAQYAKRGSASQTGFLAAPLVTDFSITGITATQADVNRLVSIPQPATVWGILVIKVSDGTVANNTQGPATPRTPTGLTTATQYRVVIAWFEAATFKRLSDWSPPQTFTTL